MDLKRIANSAFLFKKAAIIKTAKNVWYNVVYFDMISDDVSGAKWELSKSILSDPSGKDTSGIVPVDNKGDHWQFAVQPIIDAVIPGNNKIAASGTWDPINGVTPNDILKNVKGAELLPEKYNKPQNFLLSGAGYYAVIGKAGFYCIIVFQTSLGNKINREKVKETKEVAENQPDKLNGPNDITDIIEGNSFISLNQNWKFRWLYDANLLRLGVIKAYQIYFDDCYAGIPLSPFKIRRFHSMPFIGRFSGINFIQVSKHELEQILEWIINEFGIQI